MKPDPDKYSALLGTLNIPSAFEALVIPGLEKTIFIKRDDLIHPVICGNKWRKLKHHLAAFYNGNYDGIVSMGGAHSNHLHALSYTAHQLGIPCTNLIYGWNSAFQTQTILDARKWDAQCVPITRVQAAQLRNGDLNIKELGYGNRYWIPEGGAGEPGIRGCKDILEELPVEFDQEHTLIVCPCGTGTTISGFLECTRYVHIASQHRVRNALYDFEMSTRVKWLPDIQFGRFGKSDPLLRSFIEEFSRVTGIPLDIVYNGPLMNAFLSNIEKLHFKQFIYIHTGGLQGNRSQKSAEVS